MNKHTYDIDRILGAWATQNGLSRAQSMAVRNAVVDRYVEPEVLSQQWWCEFARMVVRNATIPSRLVYRRI